MPWMIVSIMNSASPTVPRVLSDVSRPLTSLSS